MKIDFFDETEAKEEKVSLRLVTAGTGKFLAVVDDKGSRIHRGLLLQFSTRNGKMYIDRMPNVDSKLPFELNDSGTVVIY